MALDVDWSGTAPNPYRIFIPRLDMPLVQASPEIRVLDVNQFRLDLRTIEAAQSGAPWPETHTHETESQLSGLLYARKVRILPPYQVEFEDGAYAVRAVGANHNVLDVKVSNSVSFEAQNSAGLINQPTSAEVASEVWAQPRSALNVAGTAGQALLEVFRLLGLDPTKPLVVGPTQRAAGAEIVQTVVEGPAGTFTVTRQ